MIGRQILKMADCRGEIVLLDRLGLGRTAYAHDAAIRMSHEFPFAMSHGIEIHLSQCRLRPSREIDQGSRIDFSLNRPAGLHGGGIDRRGVLNLNSFR